LRTAREIHAIEGVDRHLLEGVTLVVPVDEIGGRGGKARHAGKTFCWGDMPDLNEAVGIREGQGAEKDGIDNAEDGGVRADAESKDDDGGDGEAGTLGEDAEGVFKVLQQVGHGGSPIRKRRN